MRRSWPPVVAPWLLLAAACAIGPSLSVSRAAEPAAEPAAPAPVAPAPADPAPAPAAPAVDPAPAPAAQPAAPVPVPAVLPAPVMMRQRMFIQRAFGGGRFRMQNDLPDPPPRYNLAADPDDAEQDRVNNRMMAQQLLEEGRGHAENRMRSDEPKDAIDAILSLLEYSRRDPQAAVSRIECFERLMELALERRPKESTRGLVTRLLTHPLLEMQQSPEEQFLVEDYRDNYLAQLAPRYEEAAAAPWPFDWRTNEKLWTELLVQVVESKASPDMPAFFKQQIAKDAANAEWHRAAYVAALRTTRGKLELDVLKPWVDARPQVDANQIALLGELVKTATMLAPDEDDELRKSLRTRFLAELARLPVADAKFDPRVGGVLQELFQQDQREGHDAVRQILAHESPWPFYRLVSQLGMDAPAAQRMMQSRPVKVAFRDMPLNKAIAELETKVVLPIWIDEQMRQSEVKVTLEREGPWLDLLDALLEPTSFRAVFLPHQVIWIGPVDKAGAARAFFGDALARIQSTNEFAYQAAVGNNPFGQEEVSVWKFEGVTLKEALTEIKEKTSLSIECPEDSVRKAKVTFHGRDLPLPLVIALVARAAGAEWDTIGAAVVFGTPKKMTELRALVQKHERRMAALATRNDRVSKALRESSGTSASETHLGDLISFMQQSHEIGIGYFAPSGDGPSPERPMNMESRDSWAWDLDVLSFQVGLGWDYSDQGVWLAPTERLEKIRALAAARAKTMLNDEARQTLAGAVSMRIVDKPLTGIKADNDEGETLEVKFDFSGLSAETRKRKFHGAFVELPLAIALDLIAAECDARWELAGDTVRFLPAK